MRIEKECKECGAYIKLVYIYKGKELCKECYQNKLKADNITVLELKNSL